MCHLSPEVQLWNMWKRRTERKLATLGSAREQPLQRRWWFGWWL